MDEKSQIQALERSQPVIPMQIGQDKLQTHDYLRWGSTTLFAALNIATGGVLGQVLPRATRRRVRQVPQHDRGDVPEESEIHLVLDNFGMHKSALAKKWFLKHPRYHPHFTPTYSS